MRRMQIAIDSLCEGIYELAPDAQIRYVISYDAQQLKIHMESERAVFKADTHAADDALDSTLNVSLMIIRNMFDEVRVKNRNGVLTIDMSHDL